MALAFTKEEIEKELSDRLPHGRRRDVARISHLGESYLKRQFNPDDETPSCVFKTLLVISALDQLDAEQGEAFFQSIVKFRELSKPTRPASNLSLNQQTGKLNKEIADFVLVKLTDQPFEVQMRELLEARRQLDVVQEELIAEFHTLQNSNSRKVANFRN